MKKLVVITGASSGIGRATAIKLSSEGHPLLLLARRKEKLEELNLPNTICKSLDVTDIETFKVAVDEAEEKYGKVDCLVNNAGIMLLGEASNQDPNEWKKMLDVNVMGVLNGIHVVLDDMISRNEGTIINISSIAGRKTFPNHAAYCGTKFAVHAITENIREEVANHNVRIIVIAPGVVETNLLSHTTSDDIKDSYTDWKESIGGGLQAENIANVISFAYSQPQNVCIREIVIAKTRQDS
ncbi:SDR family oxidoreductase [Tepidibacter formicigenes]|jgi:NADP-dependent 3-hydroxy acid dehydrogenase YdfG|uniref:NADP-dependent 3-hydroxy acid dehydrogenase YdfG n=1 Tax=Tepidibacter formicigenes DSM 15518 TaxID=1123349 RepID=A0A1M6QT51_9FIRM|nr:SDR family oxidoreductase [Tepidibacter formicigenes]SHK23431.1 NADP-dependent 3-hydroxy acid dehydrogenase YdfG [Tepidibacter formicigenes DSM 15518]